MAIGAVPGRCRVCGRVLKDPSAIEAGIGPVCEAKARRRDEAMYAALIRHGEGFDPERDDVLLKRNSRGEPATNLPIRHRHHSPDGIEWGYGGSGPADLALNILAAFLPESELAQVELWDGTYVAESVYVYHQSFKAEMIVPIPYDGGVIRNADIRQWIEDQRRVRIRVRV